jgi:glycosyltransferase involved in cell wall biosynthesis
LPENVGLGLALNAGLSVCKHELVARMDADDIAYPNRMDLQLAAFAARTELDIVGGYVSEFYDDSDKITAIKEVPWISLPSTLTASGVIRSFIRRLCSRNPAF